MGELGFYGVRTNNNVLKSLTTAHGKITTDLFIYLFIYLDANMAEKVIAENWFLQMLNVFKWIDHNNVK